LVDDLQIDRHAVGGRNMNLHGQCSLYYLINTMMWWRCQLFCGVVSGEWGKAEAEFVLGERMFGRTCGKLGGKWVWGIYSFHFLSYLQARRRPFEPRRHDGHDVGDRAGE